MLMNMAEIEKMNDNGAPLSGLSCPFCNGKFKNIPYDSDVFLCGDCRNRLVVKKELPRPGCRAIIAAHLSFLKGFQKSESGVPVTRRIISYGEASWENHKNNYYVMIEMCVLSCIYAALSLFMQRQGSTLLIFNNLFFPAIPMGIAVYYNYMFNSRRQELMREDVPVIMPEPL
jgi:hypothetical protein